MVEEDMGCCGAFTCLTGTLLVLQIFTSLELHELFRIRLVCKSWYAAILSSPFLRMYNPPNVPWSLLKFRHQNFPDVHLMELFDYKNKLVSSHQLWLPSATQRLHKSSLPLGPPGSFFVGLGSSNGLVCGRVLNDRHQLTLAVGNPLTNNWKILPPAPVHKSYRFINRPAFIELAIDMVPATGRYTIVIFVSGQGHRVVQYDSKFEAWIHGPSLEQPTGPYPNACSRKNLRGWSFMINPLVITVYDPSSMVWSQVKLPLPNTVIHAGFRYKNRFIFAASLYESVNFLGIGVYELKDSNWTLISRREARDLLGDAWNRYEMIHIDWKVELAGDMLVFSSFFKSWTHGVWPPVAFYLARCSWHCLLSRQEIQQFWKTSAKGDGGVPASGMKVDVECSYTFVPSLKARP